MLKCGIVYDPVFKKHETGPHHPEQSNRASYIFNKIREKNLYEPTNRIPVRTCEQKSLELVHSPSYLKKAKLEIESGSGQLSTGDTVICKDSWEIASLVTGGLIEAVSRVTEQKLNNAFCISRPPGHHANSVKGMGFCIFNHIAVAARYAQKELGLEKILIVDWDVHHGNGTQDIFYEDDSVFFFSTHQSPWYPGTGEIRETGKGRGLGFTKNLPFSPGAGRKEILEFAFSYELPKKVSNFKPDLILISAGFDSRIKDPLGQFTLEDNDFYDLTKIILNLANEYCDGRIVSVLEGGYNLGGLASASISHLKALTGQEI